MAGNVQALVLRAGAPSGELPTIPLAAGCGLVLLPLTEQVVAALGDGRTVDGFYELTHGVAEWAREQSAHGDVGYLHAEFFGGHGFHAAAAWRAGELAWGPQFTATADGEAEDHYVTVTDHRDMAVNALLRWLGVDADGHADEFATAGLDRHRWTDG